jgi:YjbE family integral membrane protein
VNAVAAVLEAEFWARLLGILIIDLTLAGDNALVIALAVRRLPPRQQFWGRVWGTVGAVALRLAFIAAATVLLRVPLLQVAGGLLLIWIAVKLVRPPEGGEEHVRQGQSLWQAVWVIIVADAVMSLDNVLGVAAAAHGEMLLVVLGIGVSLPLVVWGSGLLSALIARFGWIVWLGGGILGYVAGEMMLRDGFVTAWLGPVVSSLALLPAVLGIGLTALGWWLASNGKSRLSGPGNATIRAREAHDDA